MPDSEQQTVLTAMLALNKSMYDMELRINGNIDSKHKDSVKISEAFRDSIQNIVNANFLSQQELARKVDRNDAKIDTIIGIEGDDGGRLGKVEKSVETLKQFRWQALAGLATLAWLFDRFVPHGH